MSENNIPHIVDQGASFMQHEGIKRKPLTDAEIFAIARPTEIDGTDEEVLTFAREIEKAHGIE